MGKTIFVILYWFIGHFTLQANSKISLREHQKKVVNYINNHPEQKGIILYHSPGSGKSIIALDIIKKNCNRDNIIIAPYYLKSVWILLVEQNFPNLKKCISIASYEEALSFTVQKIKKSLIILDEGHNLINKIKLSSLEESIKYLMLFKKLQNSQKIIILTATPIINGINDLSYLYNLAIGKDIFTYNNILFKTEHMKIEKSKSFGRGYFFESRFFSYFFPFWTGEIITTAMLPLFAASYMGVVIQVVSSLLGSLVLEEVIRSFPIKDVKFRYFSSDVFKDMSKKYISYYQENKDSFVEGIPTYKTSYKNVEYNLQQYKFYLKLNDKRLSKEEISLVVEDEISTEDISNSKFFQEKTHNQLLQKKGFGRQIGNLSFIEDGFFVSSPKYREILTYLQKSKKSVIYSNYYLRGIKSFAQFLDNNGYKGKYHILDPKLPMEEQKNIILDYNNDNVNILLLHPEIVEGVTLKGTEQLHVLEPVFNNQILKQIIGRVVRYKSHNHLKKEDRHVNIYIWKMVVNKNLFLPSENTYEAKRNWQKYYIEVNPSETTKGLYDIDPNHRRKLISPDEQIYLGLNKIETDISAYISLLRDHSIESEATLK
jgi:hypothetical protein